MATVEYGNSTAPRPAAPVRDPHVFAAATARRAGVLRALGIIAGVLALAWLAALALSLLGAGTLPGLLPGVPDHVQSQRHQSPAARTVPVRQQQQQLPRPASPAARPKASTPKARVSHSPSVVTAPATPATAPTPASRGQGWARRGWSAPPGQTQRTQPPVAHGKKQSDVTTTPPGQTGSHLPPKKG